MQQQAPALNAPAGSKTVSTTCGVYIKNHALWAQPEALPKEKRIAAAGAAHQRL